MYMSIACETVVLSALKEKGYRASRVREGIVSALCSCHCALSASDIQMRVVKRHPSVNKTTIYRELATLRREGIVKELRFGDGKRRYEMMPDDHHHHVICVRCNAIREVPMEGDLDKAERTIEKKEGFIILDHSLEFFGVCPACHTKSLRGKQKK